MQGYQASLSKVVEKGLFRQRGDPVGVGIDKQNVVQPKIFQRERDQVFAIDELDTRLVRSGARIRSRAAG